MTDHTIYYLSIPIIGRDKLESAPERASSVFYKDLRNVVVKKSRERSVRGESRLEKKKESRALGRSIGDPFQRSALRVSGAVLLATSYLAISDLRHTGGR